MKDILVAEDNPILADVIRFNLQRQGFPVFVAKNGLAAIERIKTQTPRLLMTDFQMPGASGEDVCRFVREDLANSDLPIVVCSAKGIELNTTDFLQRWSISKLVFKPFSMREIVDIITKLCAASYLTCEETK
jgi:CheY-like chemotaxis protein